MELTEKQKTILSNIFKAAQRSSDKRDYRTYEVYKSELHLAGIFGYEKELADALKL